MRSPSARKRQKNHFHEIIITTDPWIVLLFIRFTYRKYGNMTVAKWPNKYIIKIDWKQFRELVGVFVALILPRNDKEHKNYEILMSHQSALLAIITWPHHSHQFDDFIHIFFCFVEAEKFHLFLLYFKNCLQSYEYERQLIKLNLFYCIYYNKCEFA